MRKRPSYKELSQLINKQEVLIARQALLIEQQAGLLKKQSEQITTLKARIVALETEVTHLKLRKNSRNSSLPPSKDNTPPKPNQSLRKPTGKKPGGQLGRKGTTLEMSNTPDCIVELQPDYCNACGADLSSVVSQADSVRQIIDIPPIKATYTEYRTYSKQCTCGCITTSDFPQGVDAPISYGSNTEALIAYLHARQYVPFARMKELFNDVFALPISQGGIHYLLNRFAEKSTTAYRTIKQRISLSKVIGTDETGIKVNGNKHWFWTWQTNRLTYITHSENRGSATINTHFPEGFNNSTLVHDGWKPQLNTIAKHHQTCLPHLLRRLLYLNEKYPSNTWGKQFTQLLYKALEINKKTTSQETERIKIIAKLEHLLERPPDKKDKELYSFYKRMGRESKHLFTFLFIDEVPPDNNASERAIRNVKVKQKISGQFKSNKTAQNFAKIRSVIDTTIKNGMNVLQALMLIANFEQNIDTD